MSFLESKEVEEKNRYCSSVLLNISIGLNFFPASPRNLLIVVLTESKLLNSSTIDI